MDTQFLQSILAVFRDGGWHSIREVFAHAKRACPTVEGRSEKVRWIREHTTTNGEDRRAHFAAKYSEGRRHGQEALYRISSEGMDRLGNILRRMQRDLPIGTDHSKLLSFLSMNPGKRFSSADLSKAVFKGKANTHRVTELIRERRQQGYIIDCETDPSNGRSRLFRFVHTNIALKKMSLDDVVNGFVRMTTEHDGSLSVQDVQTSFTQGDRDKAIHLLHRFADLLNYRAPGCCSIVTNKARRGAIERIEVEPDILESFDLDALHSPAERFSRSYRLCAQHISNQGGVLPYKVFLDYVRDVCGIGDPVIFGCRMVKDGYLVKVKEKFQLKNVVADRITQVRLPDNFPMHLLETPDEPPVPCGVPLLRVVKDVQMEHCTDHFGYLLSDLPDQPVDQFKMWAREIVNGKPVVSGVRIRSMHSRASGWTPDLTDVVTPATIDLARAACHLLEQHAGKMVGKQVRLGTPENWDVLLHAMDYGFAPYLLTLSKDQRLIQSISHLHLPTRTFRALFVLNGFRDVGTLVRARENGIAIQGVGADHLARVDEAIALFVTCNGASIGNTRHPVSSTAYPHLEQPETFRRAG